MNFKSTFFLTLLCLSSSAFAIEEDKVKHFAISSVVGFAADGYFDSHEKALAACVALGLSKEIYDEIDYRGFSGEDLVADILGCGFGVASSEYLGFRLGYTEMHDAKMLTFNIDF